MNNSTLALSLAAACLLLISGISQAFYIGKISLPCNRLPTNVVPTNYHLAFDFDTADNEDDQGGEDYGDLEYSDEDEDSGPRYSGTVEISFKVAHNNQASDSCSWGEIGKHAIVLHADPSLKITHVDVNTYSCGLRNCFGSKGSPKKRGIRSVSSDPNKQMIAIELWEPLKDGSIGQMRIKFKGKLGEDKRGLHLSSYDDGQSEHKKAIVCQFAPTETRLAFPLFDEDNFKAPFQVSLEQAGERTALSDMAKESQELIIENNPYRFEVLTKIEFKQTGQISPHKLAFILVDSNSPFTTYSSARAKLS